MNKDFLGRKIIDLIEENKIKFKDNEEVIEIPLEKIKPNPEQPRVNFDSKALKQLAESIKEHGVLQPVILKPSIDNQYTLVAGERRVRASLLAGKKTVPAIIRDYNSIFLTELAILENLQREDLTPIEEAVAYEKAIKNLGLTQAELARKIGKSRSYITNVVGLLNLPLNVISDVNKGYISMGHAKILSKLDDNEFSVSLAEKIKEDKLTVRRLEEIVRKRTNKKKNNKITIDDKTQYFITSIDENLKELFKNNANIKVTNKEIKIKFKNIEDIEKTIENLIKNK